MHDLLDGLNKRQVQAVTSASPVILALAGAGSGKTTVLTRRVAHLSLNRGVDTENMLCLTFTRLAGKEMKERVIRLVGEAEGAKIFCNTFHAFAVAVLKKYGSLIDINEYFSIYDQETREAMFKQIIGAFGGRTTLKKVKECFATCGDYREEQRKRPEECRVLMEYGYRCMRNNAADLDRLIDMVIRLWELHPEILNEYRRQYPYVFVDEFQDSNDEQARLIDMLQAKCLFVVGDDFQAIYGWRGAKVQFIIDFARNNPDCEVIKLEDNYRSTKEIVALANRLIKCNINQTDKTLIAHKSGISPIVFQELDPAMEYKKIADLIAEIHGCGGAYRDIAVLARTNKFIDGLQSIFELRRIPCLRVTTASADPFKRPGPMQIFDWMNLLANGKDNESFKRCARHLNCSELDLSRLELAALRSDVPMYELSLQNGAWAYLHNAVRDLRKAAEDDLTALYQFNALAATPVFQTRLPQGDLAAAAQAIERWMLSSDKASHDCTPTAFLRYLKYRDIQDKLIDDCDAVRLMTVHGSKGLEFDTVIVGGMNQGVFPSKRGDIEEERRLAYVALTRAKSRLYITYACQTSTWSGELEDALPSQFIMEMQQN